MIYHIETAPIWDAYDNSSECPMCALEASQTNRLINLYLGEAVMESDYRLEVNKHGFCTKHFSALLEGKNRLGLALQTITRTQYILAHMGNPSDVKGAQREAARLLENSSSCVICASLDKTMALYLKTAAQMFLHEQHFSEKLDRCKGHCMYHYAKLLQSAQYAGKSANEFVKLLVAVQRNGLTRISEELTAFTGRFNASNAGSSAPAHNEASSVARAKSMLRSQG